MLSEISVSIRDEEKTLRKKFLIYDDFVVSENDETIRECIAETLKNFTDEQKPDCKITVKITMKVE